jgi:hypothetical protein
MDGYDFMNLHLFKWGLLVAILSPKNVRLELRHPDLGYGPHDCNIYKQFKWILGGFYHGTSMGAGSPKGL